MTPMEILLLLVIAGICGAIGEAIAGFSHLGRLSSVALGFIGALLGSWLTRTLELPEIFSLKIGEMRYPNCVVHRRRFVIYCGHRAIPARPRLEGVGHA